MSKNNWKKYCDSLGCWYEDQPEVRHAFLSGQNSMIKIIKFLCGPHAGMSAKAICMQATSDSVIPNAAHPHDSSDFMRCYICLEETGIDIQIMKDVSPVWDALVANWERLTGIFWDDRNNLGSAVRGVLDGVKETKE